MSTDEITIHVDAETADAYRACSEEDRRKLDVLLGLRLSDVMRSGSSLKQIMREIGQNARQRGLTPESLDSILNER